MLRLLMAVLLVPVIAVIVGYGIHRQMESTWLGSLDEEIANKQATQPPSASPSPEAEEQESPLTLAQLERLKTIPFEQICSSEGAKYFQEACDQYDLMTDLELVAAFTAALGVVLMLGIGLAGLVARQSRTLLVLLFRPGLYLTVVVLAILIVLHAGLAIASIWYGESALVGRVHVGVMLAIGAGGVLGAVSMMAACFKVVKRATTIVVGHAVKDSSSPDLHQFVKQLVDSVGTSTPDNIIVGLTPNFFVTEANVRCLDGLLEGRTLYLSLPLMRIITRSELAAIVGHELGHYKGKDTAFSHKFYPIYRGTSESLAALVATGGEGWGSAALVPAIWTLAYFLKSFAKAERRIGRAREIEADKIGAQCASPRTVGIALLKACTFAEYWTGVESIMKDALKEKKQYINLSQLFASGVNNVSQDSSIFDGLESKALPHPTDTHPPLGERLAALGLSADDLVSDARKTQPTSPAIDLVAKYEDIEKDLTDMEHALLAQQMQIGRSPSDA